MLCVLLFVAWTEESQSLVYDGHWKSVFDLFTPLVTSLPLVSLSVWQLLLFALVPFCILAPGARRRRSTVLDGAIVIAVVSTGVTFAWGLARDGSGYDAYFQLRGFLTALLVAALLASVTRSARDLKAIALTVLAAALVRATLVPYFYYFHVKGKIVPPPIYMTTHEDSLLFVAALVIVLSWALVRGTASAWWAALVVSGYLLFAIILNGRRLAWLELLFALASLYALLPRGRQRRRVTVAAAVAVPMLLLYAAVGWGRSGPLFEPLRALATSGSDADNSSLARLEETRNLLYTLSTEGNPVVGTGWGHPYRKQSSVYANFDGSWSQYLYQPHNSLLALAVFGGLVGLFGMWLVVPVAAFLGTRGYLEARLPTPRAAAMAAVAVLPAFAAQCYGDLGLKQIASTLVFAVALAVAATTASWSRVHGTAGAPQPRRSRPPVAVAG